MLSPYRYEMLTSAEKVDYLIEQMRKNGWTYGEMFEALKNELSSDYMRILLTIIAAKNNMEVWDIEERHEAHSKPM